MVKYDGLNVVEERVNGFDTVTVDILTEEAAEDMGKKIGRYIIITADAPFSELMELHPIGECLAHFLLHGFRNWMESGLQYISRAMLPKMSNGRRSTRFMIF